LSLNGRGRCRTRTRSPDALQPGTAQGDRQSVGDIGAGHGRAQLRAETFGPWWCGACDGSTALEFEISLDAVQGLLSRSWHQEAQNVGLVVLGKKIITRGPSKANM
jgi:hypothetical protein